MAISAARRLGARSWAPTIVHGGAVIHVFRFEAGRIAELWDVGQEIPEESPNENGMF